MSYILDALRRAEAERERGQVPGLHSQPVMAASPAEPKVRLRPGWLGAAAAAAMLLFGGFVWLVTGLQATPAAVVAAAPTTARRAVAAPIVQPPSPAAPRPSAAVIVEPAEAISILPVAPPTRSAHPASAPATTPAPAAPAVVPWERLPEDVRRQLPALAVSGAIWSESASNRMLIVNGQLLHEGDAAAPGVTLERIGQKSAVLRWKDLRYEVGF